MKALAAVACVAAFGVAGPAAAQSWAASARQDVQAIHDILKAQHPAPAVGRGAETFNAWIDAGLPPSTADLGKVINPPTYARALKRYARGFRDSNIRVVPNWAPDAPYFAAYWPGFSTEWKDGAYRVAYVAPGAKRVPPVGAVLVGCDGRTADQIAKERLDAFEGDLTLEADRVITAPYLLWDRANTLTRPVPGTCEFMVGKRKRPFVLVNQPATDDVRRAAYLAAVPIAQGGPTIEQTDGAYWIKVPSFAEQDGWPAFVAQLEAQRDAVRAAPKIVIDLRGADEGVVQYRLANYIWGPDFVRANSPKVGQAAFRPTPELKAFFEDVLRRQRGNDLFFYEAQRTEQLIKDIDAAIASGQTVLTRATEIQPVDGGANPVQGKVVVLTDSFCSGPCLDMMDLLTQLPNVVHAGATTSASSIYVGDQSVTLPSGNARLVFGNQAWLDRKRGDDQPYEPTAKFTGNWADEAAVRAFVAGL